MAQLDHQDDTAAARLLTNPCDEPDAASGSTGWSMWTLQVNSIPSGPSVDMRDETAWGPTSADGRPGAPANCTSKADRAPSATSRGSSAAGERYDDRAGKRALKSRSQSAERRAATSRIPTTGAIEARATGDLPFANQKTSRASGRWRPPSTPLSSSNNPSSYRR